MPVLSLGVSHRRASVDLLERLAFSHDDLPKAYRRLLGMGSVREGVVVSTCNRVEVYAEVEAYHGGFVDLKRFLAESREVDPDEFAEPLYSHWEDEAAEHLFAVAAGIDSMVLGEPQILAQVRAALKRAESEGAAGPVMAALFGRAVRAGRRARSETAIGTGPAAFVEAAAELAAGHLGGVARRSVLVVGAGEMGALAARTLRPRAGRLVVLSRTPERAARVSRLAGADGHGGLEEVARAVRDADLVVATTGSTRPVITRDDVADGGRIGRPLFVADLGVPRDVEPDVASVPGVKVAGLDDLRKLVARPGAAGEVAAVRSIVEDEVRKHAVARAALRLAPLISSLLDRAEHIRARETRRASRSLAGLREEERDAVDALTRRIIRALLHDPVVRLKEHDPEAGGETLARALAELFGLEPPPD